MSYSTKLFIGGLVGVFIIGLSGMFFRDSMTALLMTVAVAGVYLMVAGRYYFSQRNMLKNFLQAKKFVEIVDKERVIALSNELPRYTSMEAQFAERAWESANIICLERRFSSGGETGGGPSTYLSFFRKSIEPRHKVVLDPRGFFNKVAFIEHQELRQKFSRGHAYFDPALPETLAKKIFSWATESDQKPEVYCDGRILAVFLNANLMDMFEGQSLLTAWQQFETISEFLDFPT